MGDGFVTVYKRHTPFSMVQYTQPVTDKITIQPSGDLVSYVYFTKYDSTGKHVQWNWEDILEFEWWIGDKFIDRQDVSYIRYVYPKLMARTFSKTKFDISASTFLPLAFSFCTDLPFPVVSLQYQQMYIKITKGPSYDTSASYQCHINYIHLDESERMYFALTKQVIPIHRVFKVDPRNDIQLNYPIKFIATPAVKIPQGFKYSVRVNNETVRDNEPYTGSEVMFHTEYCDQGTITTDQFPPRPLTGESTLLTTEYGRGFYIVKGSTVAGNNYPWYVSDNSSSVWQSGIYTAKVLTYIAQASSNTDIAWKAFAGPSNVWTSAESFGTRLPYSIDNTYWSGSSVYGTDASKSFESSVSSNLADRWKIFDGNVFTVWTSEPQAYSSEITGNFTINASSNSATTTVLGAFTGSSYWESNSTFGVFTTPGLYSSNQYNAFSVSRFYQASNLFGRFSNVPAITLSASTGNVILAFNGLVTPWSSNSNVYGFSSYAGIYESNSTFDASNSYLAFDGNAQTSWVSNTLYSKIFTGTYNVTSSSDVSNAYLSVDMNNSTSWTSNSLFGAYIPGGTYTIVASSNSNGYVYQTLASPSNAWIGSRLYGNVLPTNSYNISASSNTLNAWTSTVTGWTGNQTYGQIRFKAGVYTDSTGVFGKVGSWVSGNNYGFSIPAGVYTCSNSSGNALGVFVDSGPWYASPSINNSNIDEFLTFTEIGPHTVTSSSNSSNAWKAFASGETFDFGVDLYKTFASDVSISSNSSNLIYDSSQFISTSNVQLSMRNQTLYSQIPTGIYRFANNFTSQNLHYPFTNQTLTVNCPLIDNATGTFVQPMSLTLVYPGGKNPFANTVTLRYDPTKITASSSNYSIIVTAVNKTDVPVSQFFTDNFSSLRLNSGYFYATFPFGEYSVSPFDAYKLFDNDPTTYYISSDPYIYITYPTPVNTPTGFNPYNESSPTVNFYKQLPQSSQTFPMVQYYSPNFTSNMYGMICPCDITINSIGKLNDFSNVYNPRPDRGFTINASDPTINFAVSNSIYINRLFVVSNISSLTCNIYSNDTLLTKYLTQSSTLDAYYVNIYSFNPVKSNTMNIVFDGQISTSNLFTTVGYNDQRILLPDFGDVSDYTYNYSNSIVISTDIPQDGFMTFPFTFTTVSTLTGNIGPSFITYTNNETYFDTQTQSISKSSAGYYNLDISGLNPNRYNINPPINSYVPFYDAQNSIYYFKVDSTNYFPGPPQRNILIGNVYNQTNNQILQFPNGSVTVRTINSGLYVTFLNGKQIWRVPKTGLYSFEVAGSTGAWGPGVVLYSSYYLQKGEIIEILVGQKPSYGSPGATFVVKQTQPQNVLLFVAGGGKGVEDSPPPTLQRVRTDTRPIGGGAGYDTDGGGAGGVNNAKSYINGGYGSASGGGFGGGGLGGSGGYTAGLGGGNSYDINNNPAVGTISNTDSGYVKINYLQAQPYLGSNTLGGESITRIPPLPESLNRIERFTQDVGKYTLYSGDTIVSSNLFSNITYPKFDQSFSGNVYRLVFTELYTSSRINISNDIFDMANASSYNIFNFYGLQTINLIGFGFSFYVRDIYTIEIVPGNGNPINNLGINVTGYTHIRAGGYTFKIFSITTDSFLVFCVDSLGYKIPSPFSGIVLVSGITLGTNDTILNGFKGVNYTTLPIVYMNKLVVDRFPDKSFIANSNVRTVDSSGGYTFSGSVDLQNNSYVIEIEVRNQSRVFPFSYFKLASYAVIKYTTVKGSNIDLQPEVSGLSSIPSNTKYLLIKIVRLTNGLTSYNDYIQFFEVDRETEISNINTNTVFTYPLRFDLPNLDIKYNNQYLLPIFPSTLNTNTFTATTTNIPTSLKTGGYYIGTEADGGEWFILNDQTINSFQSEIFGTVNKSGSKFVIATTNVTSTSGMIQLYKGINQCKPEYMPGGPYIGTNEFGGEWIQYSFPRPTTLLSNIVSFSAKNAVGVKFLKLNGSTFDTCVPGNTSNTFRIVITSTDTSGLSNSCYLSGTSFHKSVSNFESNVANVITSGMNAFVSNNTLITRMKNYTFTDATLRGVLPEGYKPYEIQFYGNVYVPYTLTAGQSIIYSSSNLVSAWIGSNADTSTNVLSGWTLGTNAFIINTTIQGGTYTRIRANVTNVNGMFDLWFSSNSGSTKINPVRITSPYFNGGPYNGFNANCWAQITLPQNTRIGGYSIDSVNANTWILSGATDPNGLFTTLSSNGLPNSYIRLNPAQSYNVYRLEVTSTLYGNSYSNINSILLFDSNNRAIYSGAGTFSNPIPIGNHPIGKYSDTFKQYSNLFNPYSTTVYYRLPEFDDQRIVDNFVLPPGGVPITGVYVSNTVSLGINDELSIPFFQGFTPISRTLNKFSIDWNSYLSKVLFFNSNGLALPTFSEYGGNYTGTQITNGEAGEYVELLLPPSNVFRYEVVSPKMPMGWSLHGNVGGSWQLLDKVTNNFSTSYSKYIYSNACSNIRLVVSNTFTPAATLVTVNVYTQNFTNVFTAQTLTSDVPESTYLQTTYNGTFFDVPTRTWVSDMDSNNSSLNITFSKPTRISRLDVYDTIRTGLQFTEFTSNFNFVSIDDLKTRSIRNCGYTPAFDIPGVSNAYFLQGYINVFSPSTQITFKFTNPSSNTLVWIDGEPSITPIAVSSITTNQTVSMSTAGYKKFYLFSNSALNGSLTMTPNKDMLSTTGGNYTGWFTPSNKPATYTDPVNISIISNSVTGGSNTHTFAKQSREFNSFIMSNTSYFDKLTINLTSTTSNLRSILSNITVFSDNGPINIQGSSGGFSKQGEWIQLKIPSGFTINSYSINTSASNIILKAGTTDPPTTIVHTQPTNPGNGKHVMFPNRVNNTYFRFDISEASSTKLTIGNIRLYDTSGLDVTPMMTSNDFTCSTVDLGQSIRGAYTYDSSENLVNSLDSSRNTEAQTGVTYNELGRYIGSQCTLAGKPLYGAWLQVELPRPHLVNTFALEITNPLQFPNNITFCASTDGINWIRANSCPVTNVNAFSDSFHRFPTTINTPHRFYRMVVSNAIPNVANISSFGKLLLLDQNRRRLNAFVDAPYTTFGGSNNVNEFIKLDIPAPGKRLKYVRITSSTNQYPSNLSINGTVTYPKFINNKYVYTVPNPSVTNSYFINVNSVNYNTTGSNVRITDMELIDERGASIVPPLTNNTNTYSPLTIPTPFCVGTFKCSNVFAFDDDTTTSWVAPQNSIVYFEFPETVTLTRYTIVDPYLTSWKIGTTTVTETLTFTNTYPISLTTSNVGFQVLGSQNIVGGLVFYDARGRLNPTMKSETQYLQTSNIRGGSHVSSNENIFINFSSPATINSYSISASPFPASWNVYVGTTLAHSVSNFFGNVTTESFQCTLGEFTSSNVTLCINETQPGTKSNASVVFFQVYDSSGQCIIPAFTSNTAYSGEEYSREVLGYYEYLASSYTDASNAFNSNPNSFYESLPSKSGQIVTQNIIMYYGNTAYSNCTDFRTILTASKGRVTDPSAAVNYVPSAPSTYGVIDWIQIKLPTYTLVTAYRVVSDNIQAWTLQGSNDGRNFTSIDSRNSSQSVVSLSVPQFYKYYRLQINSVATPGTFKVRLFDLYNTFGKINSYT